ncbi:hypothetical protein DRQ27_05905 [bacterium]|nr:MAG: hypothetical protein DRQ27_05905 [bacterium]
MKKLLYVLAVISIVCAQPRVELLYPKIGSLSQPLNPFDEIARIEIIDSTSDSIYFSTPAFINYWFVDTTVTPPRMKFFELCQYDTSMCPCSVVIGYSGRTYNIVDLTERMREDLGPYYSFCDCKPETISSDTILNFYISNNIDLIHVSPHTWHLKIGLFYDRDLGFVLFKHGFQLAGICDDSGYCIDRRSFGAYFFLKSTFHIDTVFPPEGSTFEILPPSIFIDIACVGGYFHRLDSTSAWFIIRFETITRDTFIDTVRYGDPGTFWIVPPGKHIGWRRFGVMTMYTDIPSRGYTGVVEVCLMDVTNSPEIAFGEPTHLHPEGVSCYEDWVYVDSVTGDTTVIPDIIPAPPEPVCWRFGLISEVSEAERGEDKLNLEVVGGYLFPIQVFYRISGVGQLELYDITGKVVLRRAISAKGSEKIGIDKLNSGVYFIRIVGEGRSAVRKVLVVR